MAHEIQQASGKESRIPFGTYPDVSLIQARSSRAAARQLRAGGIDPGQAKRDAKTAKAAAAAHTLDARAHGCTRRPPTELRARSRKTPSGWRRTSSLRSGAMPISTIKPREVLAALRKVEARGAIESAHKIKQIGARYSERRCFRDYRTGRDSRPTRRAGSAPTTGRCSIWPRGPVRTFALGGGKRRGPCATNS